MGIISKKTDLIEEIKPYNLNEQSYIFISYAHVDKTIAMPIFKRLKIDGYVFWYDNGIDPGTEWADFIAKKVKKCKFFIALMSRNYIASSNCKDELDFSWKYLPDDRRLLIYLEDVDMPDGMDLRNGRLCTIKRYQYESEDKFYNELYSVKNIGQFQYVPHEEESPISDLQSDSVKKTWKLPVFIISIILLLFIVFITLTRWNNHSRPQRLSYGNGVELLCDYDSAKNTLTADMILPGKNQDVEAWAVLGLWYGLTVFDDYNITIESGENKVSFSAGDFDRSFGGDERLEPDYSIFPENLRNYIEENSTSFYQNMSIKLFDAIQTDLDIFEDLGVNDKVLKAYLKTQTFEVDGETFTLYEQFDDNDCVVNIFLVEEVSEIENFEDSFSILSAYMNKMDKTESPINLFLIMELDANHDGEPEAYGNYANMLYFGRNVFDNEGNSLSVPEWEEPTEFDANSFANKVFYNFVIFVKDLKVY